MTLDELAAMLELPKGHRLYAVDELPPGHCPGVALTIVADDESPYLHNYRASDPLVILDLATYRRKVASYHESQDSRVTRQRLTNVEEPVRRIIPRREEGYTPARTPVMQSITPDVAKEWPRFPGEDLHITGEPVHREPGDEDIHFGGPR